MLQGEKPLSTCSAPLPPWGRGNPSDSRGTAALGVLLAAPHLQEVQHVLGQLLVAAQDALRQGRGDISTPRP